MQLETTFRGLGPRQSTSATRAIERGSARFMRLVDEPSSLRAAIEGGPPHRITLTLNLRRGELTASSEGHALSAAISEACDKLKAQLVRLRHRREADRHRPQASAATEG